MKYDLICPRTFFSALSRAALLNLFLSIKQIIYYASTFHLQQNYKYL